MLKSTGELSQRYTAGDILQNFKIEWMDRCSVSNYAFPKGPRDLGKYKLSGHYWENWPLVYDLDFVKDV